MSELDVLRRELGEARIWNEALVKAGREVVAERDSLRAENDQLRDALDIERRRNGEAMHPTERAEAS